MNMAEPEEYSREHSAGGKKLSDIWDNGSGTDVKEPHGKDAPDLVSGQVRLNSTWEG